MEVFLAEPAERSLQQIFYFYSELASEEIALKVVNGILDKVETLNTFPERGKLEFYLSELKQGHRFIIKGNYKVIYLVGLDKVVVTDIFDTRQDPDEIKRRAEKGDTGLS